MHKIFVYGSLMRGLGNHQFLVGSKLLGTARCQDGKFEMLDLGSFPGLYESQSGADAIGEVYLVDHDTLRRLDRLEGNGRFYTRVQRNVEYTALGEEYGWLCEAWIYLLNEPKTYSRGLLQSRPSQLVAGNDWRTHRCVQS